MRLFVEEVSPATVSVVRLLVLLATAEEAIASVLERLFGERASPATASAVRLLGFAC